MKVLFDTNVILDVLLNREPHAAASARLLSRAEAGDVSKKSTLPVYTPEELIQVLVAREN